MTDHWIFDQDGFISTLNNSINNINLEINNELKIKKEEYKNILESKITIYYTKEQISSKISESYNQYLNIIEYNMTNNFTIYFTEVLNVIKKYIVDENQRISEKVTLYTNDSSTINNRINEYKRKILNQLEEYLFILVDNLYKNILEIAYNNHIKEGLNNYLLEVEKKYKSNCTIYNFLSYSYNIGNIMYDYVKDLVNDYKNFTSYQIEFKRDYNKQKLRREIIDELGKLYDNEINPEFNKLLDTLKNITKENNEESMGYTKYDFNDTIKSEIDSKINSSLEKIKNNIEIIEIKKEEIKESWPGILDFEGIDCDPIRDGFDVLIKEKINVGKKAFNSILKETIRNNFNILLNNLVDSFGNEFFERIIKYNENFKITSLYNDLKYSLVVSLTYYEMLYQIKKKINSLTEDLKIKLYTLNNLDSIASEKNKIVLDLLNNNLDEFIENSMSYLLNYYKLFLKTDTSIKIELTDLYNIDLANTLEEISNVLEQDYKSIFNEKFKKKMVNSFTTVMNKQTQNMIETINNHKVNIRALFDDLFSLDIENILSETNNKMNETLDSIKEYNNHFKSFKIPDNLIEYIKNYGKKVIQPAYKGLESLINQETKLLTLKNLEKNSDNYEKSFNEEELIQIINNLHSSIKNDNIQAINIAINETHGINQYPEKLKNEIHKIERRNLRILNGEETEDDFNTEQSTENSLQKLLNISENTNKFVQSFEIFEQFKEIVQKNIKKLNSSYNKSCDIIDESFKEEEPELYEEMKNKSDYLYNLSLNYYQNIAEKYKLLTRYIEESLFDINNLLNQCANITYETIEKEFETMSNNTKDFEHNENKIQDMPKIKEITTSQNTQFTTEADFENLEKKVNFKFSLKSEGEGHIKNKKIVASVTNQIRPKKVTFEITNHFNGNCSKEYQIVEVEFNNINYTTNLVFDTESNNVNLTSFSNFDSFNYWVSRYIIYQSELNSCVGDMFGLELCLDESPECEDPEEIGHRELKKKEEIKKIEQKTVHI